MAEEKILVVDDDGGLLRLMKARLEAARYSVTLANVVERGVVLATQGIITPDLFLLGKEASQGSNRGLLPPP